MMQTDVKAASLAASGSIFAGRTRVRGMVVEPGASAGSIVIKDGGSGGTTVISIATAANGYGNVVIPGDGVLCSTNVYIALTNVSSATVFYG